LLASIARSLASARVDSWWSAGRAFAFAFAHTACVCACLLHTRSTQRSGEKRLQSSCTPIAQRAPTKGKHTPGLNAGRSRFIQLAPPHTCGQLHSKLSIALHRSIRILWHLARVFRRIPLPTATSGHGHHGWHLGRLARATLTHMHVQARQKRIMYRRLCTDRPAPPAVAAEPSCAPAPPAT